jgi:hypothetical protein
MKGVSDLVAADMNADGNLDLVTIASYQNSVMVWLGDGAGNFTVAAKAPTEMESGFSLAVADVNGDGIPDVATANQDGSASIFLGMGNGKLQPPYSYPANDFPLWIGAGNYYGSDIADLAVLDGAGNHVPDISISLLRNAGSGHFAGLTDMCFIDAGSFVLADMTRWHSRLGGDGRQQFAGARGGLDPAGIGKWAIRERHR